MNFLSWIGSWLSRFNAQQKDASIPTPSIDLSVPLPTFYTNPMQCEDFQLTKNFSFYELTRTDHADLQAMNRILTAEQIEKLIHVAEMLELVRTFLGDAPIDVHSGYRCPALNKAVGSKLTSQHLLCEAADFTVKGQEIGETFRKLRSIAKEGRLCSFGQMIFEKANRSYGVEAWMHLSLGKPYRSEIRCGEIALMNDENFKLLEQIA